MINRQAPGGDTYEGERFVTVAVFDDVVNARIVAGRLEVEGFAVRIEDQHLVQMDWLYALAVGGIKVQVLSSDVPRAQRVLQDDYSDCLPSI
ncbi:MAG: putative signal transducing protein [Gammaproteobacteria bacterium]